MVSAAASVIITGASGDIGQALCLAFSSAGFRTIGIDRPGTASLADIHIECDLKDICINDAEARRQLAAVHTAIAASPLHVLVNNAAVQILGTLETLDIESWRHTLDVNLLAPVVLMRSFLGKLEAGGGSVVNIGSIHAVLTKARFSAYATSKAALSALTRSLALELGGRVRVNAVCPAAINTAMLAEGFRGREADLRRLNAYHPTGTIGQPQDVARAAVFLANPANSFLNGCLLGLDGGISTCLSDPG